jgi:hypothetical protein
VVTRGADDPFGHRQADAPGGTDREIDDADAQQSLRLWHSASTHSDEPRPLAASGSRDDTHVPIRFYRQISSRSRGRRLPDFDVADSIDPTFVQ